MLHDTDNSRLPGENSRLTIDNYHLREDVARLTAELKALKVERSQPAIALPDDESVRKRRHRDGKSPVRDRSPSPRACPIPLIPADSRLTTFPIGRPATWKFYEIAERLRWSPSEMSFKEDVADYSQKLSPGMQRLVDYILAFFAGSEALVNENAVDRFRAEITIPEVRYFYDQQIAIENIHAWTYSLLINEIIPDRAKRVALFQAIETMPVIARMTKYIQACTASDAPFVERVLRMACVEGIFFTGCFCVIYWLASQGLMPRLSQSNGWIARDENLHTAFSLHLYSLVPDKLHKSRVAEIIREATNIACEFVCDAIPKGMDQMNSKLMSDYIQTQADNLAVAAGYAPIYGATHQFAFMNMLNTENRGNFFERPVTEYSHAPSVSTDDKSYDELI